MKKIVLLIITLALISGCSTSKAASVYDDETLLVESHDIRKLEDTKEEFSTHEYHTTLKLEGSATVWTIDSKQQQKLNMEYELQVRSGKAKLILIQPDNHIVLLSEKENVEGTVSGSSIPADTVTLQTGISRIRLIGKDMAEINLRISSAQGEMKTFVQP